MSAHIQIEGLSLRFRIYHEPPDLKKSVIRWLLREKKRGRHSDFYALKNVSLRVREGERVGLIGLNGAGKSTLLKTLVGIYQPTEGRVEIAGKVVPLLELGTGFDAELSGRENIYLNGAIIGKSRGAMARIERDIIDFSELDNFIDVPVKYYSSGMVGRLAFSIGSMVEPEVLLIDEVFSVGDAHFISKATSKIDQLLDSSRIFLFVSHSLDLVAKYCNRVVLLHGGEVLRDGAPDEVIGYYRDQVSK